MRPYRDWDAITKRIEAEGALTVCKASRTVPAAQGRHASPTTLVRWIVHGRRGVLLDGARLNGKSWWTSVAAIKRFQAELAEVEAGAMARPKETVIRVLKRQEAAHADLLRMVGMKPE